MSNNDEVYVEDPEEEKGRTINVHVIKDNEEEKYKKMVESLAEKEYDAHIQNLIKTFPEHEDEIREKSPDEITSYELGLWKDAGQNKSKKVSSGVVGLQQGASGDPVEAVFTKEYDTQLEMIQALKKLKRNPDLTPEQKRRVLDAEDSLWAGLRNKPTRTMEIKERTKYNGKSVFLVLCDRCGEEVPQREFAVHYAQHKRSQSK